MRFVLAAILLAGSAHAQNHLDRQNYTITLETAGAITEQRNSEYYYEVEIISNYGTLEVAKQVAATLRRLQDMKEEMGAGRLFRAPLEQWFPSEQGGVNLRAKLEFTRRLDKKIEGLQELTVLCEQLHSQAMFRTSSERIKYGKEAWWNNTPTEISLGEILTTFRVSELVEAVEKVMVLPELEKLPGTPVQAKEDVLEKIKVTAPTLLWTIRVYQKDPGSKARVIRESTAASDIRPNLDSMEYRPLYAQIAVSGDFEVKASIVREQTESRKSCYRPAVGF
jgi:hypothetical protein